VFLAGESAHHISIYGGFGMNTGIGDAANLGWKLNAVIRGWADPRLLDSYSEERVPVVKWIRDLCEESTQHVGPRWAVPGMEEPGPAGDALRRTIGERIVAQKRRELVSFGAQFGAAYGGSSVVVGDGTKPPAATFGEFTPSASPGARAPHIWLEEGHSLFDEIAHQGFTLLRLDPNADTRPMERAAAARGVPLKIATPTHKELRSLYQAPLALIRPDHHVAWRGDCSLIDSTAVIDVVRGAAPRPMGATPAEVS